MKKYQLIGRKSNNRFPKRKEAVTYPVTHLHSLPLEIQLRIFGSLHNDGQSLLPMARTCSHFYQIICKYFLYRQVQFHTSTEFFKFAHQHLTGEVSNKINYLENVMFINPQIKKSSSQSINIGGSYAVESNSRTVDTLSYTGFISTLGTLFSHAYGLKCMQFTEIAPEFAFPLEYKQKTSTSLFKRKAPKRKRSLDRLVLRPQSGWSIPLKDIHLSLFCEYFDTIRELHLIDFIIDQPINVDIKVQKVTFQSCSYSIKKIKAPSPLFKDVSSLELQGLTSSMQLSLIDLVKLNNKLNTLILDLKSTVFYTNGEFNFTKFNPFFRLLCSGEGNYANLRTLVLKNFDLFNYLKHDNLHEDIDSWIEPPTNNFETFMKYVSFVPNLIILLKKTPVRVNTCKKCGFKKQQSDKLVETLTPQEWEIFLKPLELQENNLKIQSHDLVDLYTISEYS
ncbi:hypothetical protein CANMA_005129 [Candida margitis]|uniref:uncharacterized protein n=1 Tax=Candida margitis TaxID=1775924 RepID=UPI002225E3A1|nr:uncharacterized protein CANMA_005129 [Candida margitis]KAI5952050.1 hypothetical protein CANMA_005129 [Candida margitis]